VCAGIGKFLYAKAFGPKSPTEPMTLDATFIMASCTKLMTSIAALQCVERGQISLDEDLSNILTEFKGIEILTGFEGEEGNMKPVLKKAENKITLRCAPSRVIFLKKRI
jgi:CubicO group peptidase (beta-lactamase class C family)